MMYVDRYILIVLIFLSQLVSAVKMDETTHDMIIQRLELGIDGMDKNEPERTGIMLRLADLYADRGRIKAMNEVESKCEKCTGAQKDRTRAISLYQEALPKVQASEQGRRVL